MSQESFLKNLIDSIKSPIHTPAMSTPKFIHDRMPTLAEREQFAQDDFRGCGWMFFVILIIVLAFAFHAVRSHLDARTNSLPKQENAK